MEDLPPGKCRTRVTMASARLVMQNWGAEYKTALELSRMELGLLAGYVDDVRQGGTGIRFGLRFEIEDRKWS